MANQRKPAPKTTKKPSPRQPKTHPRLTRPRLIGLSAAVIILLIAAYIAAGFRTAASYQSRLASGSFNFTGSFIFTGQDFLSPMDTNLNFNGSYRSAGTGPMVSTTFTGKWATRDYTGEARLAASRLYFNLSGPVMPVIRYRQSSYLVPLQAHQWYSAKTDESIYDNLCAHDQPASLQGKLELYRMIKSLKLTPSPWINFWSRLQGSSATHLSATLSGNQLAQLWDAVQQAAPPGCSDPNTLGITSADLEHVSAVVGLTSAHNGRADQLTITLTDKTLEAQAAVSLLTSDYGQASPAPVPATVTDLNALYSQTGLR